MNDSTADDRGKYAGVGDCFWGDPRQIAIENHEIRKLSSFDRSSL